MPDLDRAIAFYTGAFGLTVTRRFGADGAELTGWAAPVYLLRNVAGSIGAAGQPRCYERHWTPVHLDVVVEDLTSAVDRAIAAGAILEAAPRAAAWGQIAGLSDPFGHGLCLIEFRGRGYDEVATPV